jgi:lipase
MSEIAQAMFSFPDYTDAAEARMEKSAGSWADVDPALLDTEIDEHLIRLPGGRYGWRVSMPAMMSYWSELARDIVLPPAGTATTLVRAKHTLPPYVGDRLIAGLRDRLGSGFELLDFDCNHMVPLAEPTEVAALVRKLLDGR